MVMYFQIPKIELFKLFEIMKIGVWSSHVGEQLNAFQPILPLSLEVSKNALCSVEHNIKTK